MEAKKVFILKGLGCANCAAKMENKINKLDGVKTASVNFMSKKLTLEVNNKKELKKIVSEASSIIKSIESDVELLDEDENKHQESKEEFNLLNKVLILVVGILFYIPAFFIQDIPWLKVSLFLISYLLIGRDVLIKSIRNIFKGQIFDENFLMSIATIGAISINQYPEAAAVMLFYEVGELLQDSAVDRSRKSIVDIMNIRPDYANLKSGEVIKKVSPEEVQVGQLIVVKPGEKIPLDGSVVQGESMVDTSSLTGESMPKSVKAGDYVLSGCINKNSLLTIEVKKVFRESTVSRILELVENAGNKKAPLENFITRFAAWYTPAVVFLAMAIAVIPPFLLGQGSFSQWLYRALVFLVISCPCALVISIPLGFFGGIGSASKNGILVKGGNYLEALSKVGTVVFDKTGTLTEGIFEVTDIRSEKGFSKEELLKFAAYAESFSNHPIALSIINAYEDMSVGKNITNGMDNIHKDIEAYHEISGQGIKAVIFGRQVYVGNAALMKMENIKFKDTNIKGSTVIHTAVNCRYAGYIVISDKIREDSRKTIDFLKNNKINKIVMLTGDNHGTASAVSERLGIKDFHAELLPDEKLEVLEKLLKEKPEKSKLVFIGDGINDAPVLTRADIGIAMGGVGSDAAIEAADIVFMTDEPSKLITAVKISKYTNLIVWQNIIFALSVKIVLMFLGTLGIASMWEAVFGDVGVALIAVLNSMRVVRKNFNV